MKIQSSESHPPPVISICWYHSEKYTSSVNTYSNAERSWRSTWTLSCSGSSTLVSSPSRPSRLIWERTTKDVNIRAESCLQSELNYQPARKKIKGHQECMKQMKTQRVRLFALTDSLPSALAKQQKEHLLRYDPKGIWRRLPTNVTNVSIQFRMQTNLKKHMETQSSGSFALVSSLKGSAHLPSEEEQQRMSTEWAPLCATDSNSINSFTTLNLSIKRSKKLTFYNKLASHAGDKIQKFSL